MLKKDLAEEQEEKEEDASVWLSRGRRRGSLMVLKFTLESVKIALEVNLTLQLASKWLLLSEVVWHIDPLFSDKELISKEISMEEEMTYNKIEGLSMNPAVPKNSTGILNIPPRVVATTDKGPGYTRVILTSLTVTVLLLLLAIVTILKKGRQRIFSKNCFPATSIRQDLEENPVYKSRPRLGMDLEDTVYAEPRRPTILKRTSRNRSCGTLLTSNHLLTSPSLLSPTSFLSSPTTLLSSPSLLSPNLDHYHNNYPSRFGSTPHFHRPSSALPPLLPPPTSYSFSLELDTFDTAPDHLLNNSNNISQYMNPNLPRHEESHYAASDIFSPQPIRVEPSSHEERSVVRLDGLPRLSSEIAFLGHF